MAEYNRLYEMYNKRKITKCTKCTNEYKGHCIYYKLNIMTKKINPYMPAFPVSPENFAGREQILEDMREAFQYTTHAKAINIAVVGEWGIGKTALLLKAQEISKDEYNAISFIVDVQSGQSSQAVLHVIIQKFLQQIQREYPALGLSGGSVREMRSPRLDRITQQIKESGSYSAPLFESNLLDLWEAIAEKDRIVLIMVDNLEFLERQELFKTVETIRNVFQALPRNGCKIMIILSGKKIFYDTSAKLYSPTTRFFRRVLLEEFTEKESLEAITLPLRDAAEFDFSKEAKTELYRLSQGHPYILKTLCFLVFKQMNGKGKVSKKKLDELISSLIEGLGKDVFESMLERASDEEKKIIFALAESKKEILSFSEIQSLANMSKRGTHLSRLVEKELVLRSSRGRYQLFHPLFKEFLRKQID